MISHDGILERLRQWADAEPSIRAVILTSSRAIPHAQTDAFSDYDVILALTDIQPFYNDRKWLETFGSVLAVYRDPLIEMGGFQRSAYVTQYDDSLKIDFNLWPVELLKQIVSEPQLIPEFDAGYDVLLDKDHLTDTLPPPAYKSYIPKRPTEAEFQALVESFFLDTAYVAKFLWRDDLLAAKYILDHSLKHQHLLIVLGWRIEIDHQWALKLGPYGRNLKRYLPQDVWTALEETYTGAELSSNWLALYHTIDLMHRVAGEVAEHLGFSYPEQLEQRVVSYLRRVERFPCTRSS